MFLATKWNWARLVLRYCQALVLSEMRFASLEIFLIWSCKVIWLGFITRVCLFLFVAYASCGAMQPAFIKSVVPCHHGMHRTQTRFQIATYILLFCLFEMLHFAKQSVGMSLPCIQHGSLHGHYSYLAIKIKILLHRLTCRFMNEMIMIVKLT